MSAHNHPQQPLLQRGRSFLLFEDMLDEALYADFIKNKYGASLESPRLKGKGKWSDRVKAAFEHQGKVWSGKLEGRSKATLRIWWCLNPASALNVHQRGSFDGLVVALEAKLATIGAGKGP